MSIIIGDVEHVAKSLTLPQVRTCRALDENGADVQAISLSYGIDGDAAAAWFNSVPAGSAQAALAEVFQVSGLSEGAQKSS